MQSVARCPSPLGPLTLAGEKEALTGLWFDGQKYFAATLPRPFSEKELPVFAAARRWLDLYFSGKDPGFLPPLAPEGSPFRHAVWDLLLRIPRGGTVTYGELAKELSRQLGRKVSAQAVGGAVGHNPLSLMIPCHRVVGADGNLTGYAGGTDKKLYLLRLEGADISRLYLPRRDAGK